MKKILALVLTLVLVFTFCSCNNNSSTSTVTDTPQEDGSEKAASEPISIGNKITVDFAEITVDEACVANDIKQSIKTGHITYTSGPDSSDSKEFVYIRGTIKNTSKSEITSPALMGCVTVDGYSYDLDSSIIEENGSSTYTLAPLMTYTYTLYAEVPNELIENHSEYTMDFGFEENLENIHFSDDSHVMPYNYTINISK